MKKISVILIFILCAQIFCGCSNHTITEEYQLIRLHIRANSNLGADQSVKIKVRDKINAHLQDALKGIKDFETAYAYLVARESALAALTDGVLKENGFAYKSRVKVRNEFFPTRTYEGIIVESGNYDALIIELGEGKGDNWWCVVYPPLCYLTAGEGDFAYRSAVWEFLKKLKKA